MNRPRPIFKKSNLKNKTILANVKHSVVSVPTIDENLDDLLVFGYACKIFTPDENARIIGKEKHLIPWNGDYEQNILIDRYDARASLHDLSDFGVNSWNVENETSEEEARIERMCDAERYLALHTDILEERIRHEEEMKRLHASINDDGGYGQVQFNYDNNSTPAAPVKAEEPIQDEEKPFMAPASLALPSDIEIPATDKMHKIIEKTALFVSKQGSQMEIVLKAKQSNNSQFNFLLFDHYLNPYYKHMVKRMKAGKYVVAKEEEVEAESESDSDSDSGGYLHPSLFASSKQTEPENKQEKLKPIQQVDPSHPLAKLIERGRRTNAIKQILNMNDMVNAYYFQQGNVRPTEEEFNKAYEAMTEAMRHTVIPPPNVQPIVDNIARQVAENGEAEENRLRLSHEGLVDFLDPTHELHPYFIFRKVTCIQQLELMKRQQQEQEKLRQLEMEARKREAEEMERKRIEEEEANKLPISFEIKSSVDVSSKKNTVLKNNPLKDDESDQEEVIKEVLPPSPKPRRRFQDHPPEKIKETATKANDEEQGETILSHINAAALNAQKTQFNAVTPSGVKSSISLLREKQLERKQKALMFMQAKSSPVQANESTPSPPPLTKNNNIANEDIFNEEETNSNDVPAVENDGIAAASKLAEKLMKPTLKDLITSQSATNSMNKDNGLKKARSRSRSHSRTPSKRKRSRSRSRSRKSSRKHASRRRHPRERDPLPSSYKSESRHSPLAAPKIQDSDSASDNMPSAYRHVNVSKPKSHRKSRRRSSSVEKKKHSKKKKKKHSKKSKKESKKKKSRTPSPSSSDGELSDTGSEDNK